MIPSFTKERELNSLGYKFICGIDEAGRGALAGPLVAGAVILKTSQAEIFNDSKALTKNRREELFDIITKTSISWSVAIATVEEINKNGIQAATYLCYERAIKLLSPQPNFLIIDHYRLPGTFIPQLPITKGDKLSQSIAAASIVAKVYRDKLMSEIDLDFPDYKLKSNYGYGTSDHLKAISLKGPCEIHRKSFIDKPGSNQLNFI